MKLRMLQVNFFLVSFLFFLTAVKLDNVNAKSFNSIYTLSQTDPDSDFCDSAHVRENVTTNPDIAYIAASRNENRTHIKLEIEFYNSCNLNPNIISLFVGGYIYLDTDRNDESGFEFDNSIYYFNCPDLTPAKQFFPIGAEYCIDLYSMANDDTTDTTNQFVAHAPLLHFDENNFVNTTKQVRIEVRRTNLDVIICLADIGKNSYNGGAMYVGVEFSYAEDDQNRVPHMPKDISTVDICPNNNSIFLTFDPAIVVNDTLDVHRQFSEVDKGSDALYLEVDSDNTYEEISFTIAAKLYPNDAESNKPQIVRLFKETQIQRLFPTKHNNMECSYDNENNFEIKFLQDSAYRDHFILPKKNILAKLMVDNSILDGYVDAYDTLEISFKELKSFNSIGKEVNYIKGLTTYFTNLKNFSPDITHTEDQIVTKFTLDSAYPNPFNSNINIEFSLSSVDEVNLAVYNMNGQKIKTISQGKLQPGQYIKKWNGVDTNGNSVSSGTYFICLRTDNVRLYRKILYLK